MIEQDMIAVTVTADQREVTADQREAVVAAPAYLSAHGTPEHPRDLVRHRCIGWRPAPQAAPYRWEFEEGGVPFDVAVQPQITTNDLWFMLRSTLAGAGITFATEDVRDETDMGYSRPHSHGCVPIRDMESPSGRDRQFESWLCVKAVLVDGH